jgi:hypothetical protein
MLTENVRMMRQKFMPIAILEIHQMIDPVLNEYDICERLGSVWLEIEREAQAHTFTLDADYVQSIKERIARSLGLDAGIFRDKEGWATFIDAQESIGGIDGAHLPDLVGASSITCCAGQAQVLQFAGALRGWVLVSP